MNEIPEGQIFSSRKEVADAGLHKPLIAGVAGNKSTGAYSVVLSGGYEDDEDYGSVIIYTGGGGRDPATGKQIEDQELTGVNEALAVSKLRNLPINVIRGAQHKSKYSPAGGYMYCGKYYVTDYWAAKGKSGHRVYRFRLEKQLGLSTAENVELPVSERRTYEVERIIRDTKAAKSVKELYEFTCQVCRLAIALPLGVYYAEAAHIQPLGRPHEGPDLIDNLLCLCPNHHVMFDNYVFTIEPGTYKLRGLEGSLYVHPEHRIGDQYLQYHNDLFGQNFT